MPKEINKKPVQDAKRTSKNKASKKKKKSTLQNKPPTEGIVYIGEVHIKEHGGVLYPSQIGGFATSFDKRNQKKDRKATNKAHVTAPDKRNKSKTSSRRRGKTFDCTKGFEGEGPKPDLKPSYSADIVECSTNHHPVGHFHQIKGKKLEGAALRAHEADIKSGKKKRGDGSPKWEQCKVEPKRCALPKHGHNTEQYVRLGQIEVRVGTHYTEEDIRSTETQGHELRINSVATEQTDITPPGEIPYPVHQEHVMRMPNGKRQTIGEHLRLIAHNRKLMEAESEDEESGWNADDDLPDLPISTVEGELSEQEMAELKYGGHTPSQPGRPTPPRPPGSPPTPKSTSLPPRPPGKPPLSALPVIAEPKLISPPAVTEVIPLATGPRKKRRLFSCGEDGANSWWDRLRDWITQATAQTDIAGWEGELNLLTTTTAAQSRRRWRMLWCMHWQYKAFTKKRRWTDLFKSGGYTRERKGWTFDVLFNYLTQECPNLTAGQMIMSDGVVNPTYIGKIAFLASVAVIPGYNIQALMKHPQTYENTLHAVHNHYFLINAGRYSLNPNQKFVPTFHRTGPRAVHAS